MLLHTNLGIEKNSIILDFVDTNAMNVHKTTSRLLGHRVVFVCNIVFSVLSVQPTYCIVWKEEEEVGIKERDRGGETENKGRKKVAGVVGSYTLCQAWYE